MTKVQKALATLVVLGLCTWCGYLQWELGRHDQRIAFNARASLESQSNASNETDAINKRVDALEKK